MSQDNKPLRRYANFIQYKIGNAFVLILEYFPKADHRRLLDLLYFLNETYVRSSQCALFTVDFEVWEQGPVQKDFYADLTERMWYTNTFLERYTEDGVPGKFFFRPRQAFDKTFFNPDEVDHMRHCLKVLHGYSESQFDRLVRGDDSLWARTAEKAGVLHDLRDLNFLTTPVKIDFTLLFDNEEDKEEYRHNTSEKKLSEKTLG